MCRLNRLLKVCVIFAGGLVCYADTPEQSNSEKSNTIYDLLSDDAFQQTAATDAATLPTSGETELSTASAVGVGTQSQHLIIGVQNQAPLSPNVSLYCNATLALPGSASGYVGSNNEVWDVSAGFQYSFGGKAPTCNISGQQCTPLLPVANNGSFLIRASNFFSNPG